MKNCTKPPRTFPPFLLAFVFLLKLSSAIAQGGPPMLTDDSAVPSEHGWEANLGFEYTGSKNENVKAFPIIDLNYGLTDRIQLKTEFTWVAGNGEHIANKFDNITLGFKYRIINGKDDEFSLSVYPQPIISFNPEEPGSSVEYGISLPVAINKEFGGIAINAQAGYEILGKKSEFFFGICLEHEFAESFSVLAEFRTTVGRTPDIESTGEDAVYFKAGSFLNLGAHVKLSEDYGILLGIGKDIDSPRFSSPDANFYAYLGFQILM